MIHTLKFNLPEESEELKEHMNGPKYQAVLWDLLEQKLRPITKHGIIPDGYKSEEVVAFAEEIRTYVYDLLREEGVDL
jgi:hypothetical protein